MTRMTIFALLVQISYLNNKLTRLWCVEVGISSCFPVSLSALMIFHSFRLTSDEFDLCLFAIIVGDWLCSL